MDQQPGAPSFTDDDIRSALRYAATQAGEPLSRNAYHALDIAPSVSLIETRFGSWRQACDAAGVASGGATRDYRRSFTDEELLTVIRRYLADPAFQGVYSRYPRWRATQTDADTLPSHSLIRLRFGTWNTAINTATSATEPTSSKEPTMTPTPATVITALRNAAALLTMTPTPAQYDALHLQPTSATIISECGTWENACRAAALDLPSHDERFTQPLSASQAVTGAPDEQRMIAAVQEYLLESGENGSLAGYQRWHATHAPHQPTAVEVKRTFRSWAKAVAAASDGLDLD